MLRKRMSVRVGLLPLCKLYRELAFWNVISRYAPETAARNDNWLSIVINDHSFSNRVRLTG